MKIRNRTGRVLTAAAAVLLCALCVACGKEERPEAGTDPADLTDSAETEKGSETEEKEA